MSSMRTYADRKGLYHQVIPAADGTVKEAWKAQWTLNRKGRRRRKTLKRLMALDEIAEWFWPTAIVTIGSFLAGSIWFSQSLPRWDRISLVFSSVGMPAAILCLLYQRLVSPLTTPAQIAERKHRVRFYLTRRPHLMRVLEAADPEFARRVWRFHSQ